jgi:iron complex transport system ATP-binding protein
VLTEQLLREAYQAQITLVSSPLTGRPLVLPTGATNFSRNDDKREISVHVVCGGGTGSELMRLLTIAGYQVSAGVLNRGDADNLYAQSLGITVASEAPFSPIGEDARRHNRQLLRQAQVAMLSKVPFGKGNLANLEELLEFSRQGKKVIVIKPTQERDYTHGTATRMLKQLKQYGAVEADSERMALSLLLQWEQAGQISRAPPD